MERFRQQRLRTGRSGRIVFDEGRSVVDCRVRDLSPHGARLLVASVTGVPDRFMLKMPERSWKACRIVWKGTDDMGVVFVDEDPC